jgi:hypothetical protein
MVVWGEDEDRGEGGNLRSVQSLESVDGIFGFFERFFWESYESAAGPQLPTAPACKLLIDSRDFGTGLY